MPKAIAMLSENWLKKDCPGIMHWIAEQEQSCFWFGTELCDSFTDPSIVPAPFRAACGLVSPDGDGAAYRYYFDRFHQKPFFTYKDRPEIGLVTELYNSIDPHTGFSISDLFPDVNYRKRRTWWDLTFHLGECQQLAHIRTQYDETLEYIIEGILLEG